MNYKKHTNLTLIDCTIEDIEKKAPWFLEAETQDAKVGFNILELIVFVSGTWKSGTWEYGHWESGIWQGGTWEGGVWKTGHWENGNWKGGIWEDGIWIIGKITQNSNKPPINKP